MPSSLSCLPAGAGGSGGVVRGMAAAMEEEREAAAAAAVGRPVERRKVGASASESKQYSVKAWRIAFAPASCLLYHTLHLRISGSISAWQACCLYVNMYADVQRFCGPCPAVEGGAEGSAGRDASAGDRRHQVSAVAL